MAPKDDDEVTTAWENQVVAQAVQATLGLISQHVVLISVGVEATGVELAVAVDEGTKQAVAADLEDICFELDVLLEGKVAINAEVVEIKDGFQPPVNHRRIFMRHLRP